MLYAGFSSCGTQIFLVMETWALESRFSSRGVGLVAPKHVGCFYHLIHFNIIFEPKFFKGMSLTIYFHDKSGQIKNML